MQWQCRWNMLHAACGPCPEHSGGTQQTNVHVMSHETKHKRQQWSCTLSMAEHWTCGTAKSLSARPRDRRAAADCRKNAWALLHLIWSISMPKPEATPGLSRAWSKGLHKENHRSGFKCQLWCFGTLWHADWSEVGTSCSHPGAITFCCGWTL